MNPEEIKHSNFEKWVEPDLFNIVAKMVKTDTILYGHKVYCDVMQGEKKYELSYKVAAFKTNQSFWRRFVDFFNLIIFYWSDLND